MKLRRLQFGDDDFLPSVTTLVSGTTLAMAITYVARPVLTRLYTPEMFGMLGVFTAIVAVLSTVSSARYDDAVMLPEDDRKARNVVLLSLAILIGLTLASVPLALFKSNVAAGIGKPELAPYLALVPISLLCAGAVRLLEVWQTRQKRFRSIAAARAMQSATSVPVQLAAGLRDASSWGLVGGLVVGQAAAALTLTVRSWRQIAKDALPTLEELRGLAVRYKDFPLFSGPSALLNSASSQLPAFLLFLFFDAAVVGHYAQAYALLAVPIGLVGSSVAQVYFEKAARSRAEGGLDKLTADVFRRLFRIGLFPMCAVLVAGADILEFVLGPEWRTAGSYAQWLSVWLLFVFLASPLTRLFDVLEKLRANLGFNVGLFVVRAAILLATGLLATPLVAIALYGIVSAVMYLGLLVWLLRLADVELRSIVPVTARTVGLALAPIAMVGASVAYGLSPALVTGVTCVAGVLYYYAILALRRRSSPN